VSDWVFLPNRCRPAPSIQCAILNGLAYVGNAEMIFFGEVRDRPRDLGHAVIRPRGQPEPIGGVSKQLLDRR